MSRTLSVMDAGNRGLAYGLGVGILAAAVGAAYGGYTIAEIRAWALEAFGLTFIAFIGALIFAVLFIWVHQRNPALTLSERAVWSEAGQHAAGGIATLALTYTLLGISLGVATMADQDLTPETVQAIIKDLTRHFSRAFMTTVVGLPLSALAQALIRITDQKMAARTANMGDVR